MLVTFQRNGNETKNDEWVDRTPEENTATICQNVLCKREERERERARMNLFLVHHGASIDDKKNRQATNWQRRGLTRIDKRTSG